MGSSNVGTVRDLLDIAFQAFKACETPSGDRDTKITILLTAVEVHLQRNEPSAALGLLEATLKPIAEHNNGDWDIE
jgi:hypothetical protein